MVFGKGFLVRLKKNLKKYENNYQHFGLRNAVYYEGWEFVSYWDGFYGEFG